MLFQDITTSVGALWSGNLFMLSVVGDCNSRSGQELLTKEQNKQIALSDVEGNDLDVDWKSCNKFERREVG